LAAASLLTFELVCDSPQVVCVGCTPVRLKKTLFHCCEI
jgi:hypothetical protein